MNKKVLLRTKRLDSIKLFCVSTLIMSLVAPSFNQIYAVENNIKNKHRNVASLNLESKKFIEAFPDENFRNALRDLKFKKNDDDIISPSDPFFNETELILNYKNIESLDGIEYFTSLTKLRCEGNQLKTLDVSNNISLTVLSCSRNKLSELDVSNNISLTELDCTENQLSTLDVSNNISLTGLDCTENQLSTLDVSNNISLTILHCTGNQLKSLDVSNNISLTALHCSDNQLSTLDVSNNISLTSLDCYNNQLSTLDVSNIISLLWLECSRNKISELDVSKNISLTTLYCEGNQLKTLDVSNNISLTVLNCSRNKISELDVSNNISLTGLNCDYNQLTTLDVSNNISFLWSNFAYQTRVIKVSKQNNGKYSVYIGSLPNITDYSIDKTSSGEYIDGYIVWDDYNDIPDKLTYDYIINKHNKTMDVTLFINKSNIDGNNGGGGGGGGSDPDPSKTVILASGEKYTDVLTATVLGNEKDAPILLATKDNIDEKTLTEIKRLSPNEIIISGGEASVSKKVVDQLSGYKVTRIAGQDRYETAEKIGNEVRKTGNKDGAMLVDGTNFPDVITISSLASQKRVPILLTEPKDLNTTTKNTIGTWGVNNVTIGGSYNSVSKDIENNLSIYKVTRFGGVDRYETAELIGNEVRKAGSKDNMLLVDGTNFPDGITINSLASNFKSPIMLTQPNVLNNITANKISEWTIKNVLIGGGYHSVSKQVENNLNVSKKERVAGQNRYETAVKISERLSNKSIPIGDNK